MPPMHENHWLHRMSQNVFYIFDALDELNVLNTVCTMYCVYWGNNLSTTVSMTYFVMSFCWKRLSYCAVMAREATKEQSETTVWKKMK